MAISNADYYQLLGVDRTASQEEIRKAYRERARKLHPDVNEEPDAEERFKALGEAYRVLSDPDSRARYDRYGADWEEAEAFERAWQTGGGAGAGRGPGGGVHVSGDPDAFRDLFGDLFGGAAGFDFRPRSERGVDQEIDLPLTLDEVLRPGRKTLQVRRQHADPAGRVKVRTETVEVDVPVGVVEGSRIRLRGQGGPGLHGGEPGDLYLTVHLQPDRRWRPNGHDLRGVLQVTPAEAALGARVPVRTPWGEGEVSVPPGSSAGSVLRLRGQGLPIDARGRGDLHLEVRPWLPETLTGEERRLYDQLLRVAQRPPRREGDV